MPDLPLEQLARQQIDAQLVACGWLVQDYKQFNPSAGRGIALREAPLKSGTCDYLLLVDRKAVGVAEAKKQGTLLSGVAEQSGHYAENLPDFIQAAAPGPLPFLYESTGVETFFRDERDPEPRSRRVFSFHRPETLAAWLTEPATLRARLAAMPVVHPLPPQNLRACQIGCPVHRTVSRPHACSQDPHLLQGRVPRRGHCPSRPRDVWQGQRLRKEDHLQDLQS